MSTYMGHVGICGKTSNVTSLLLSPKRNEILASLSILGHAQISLTWQ